MGGELEEAVGGEGRERGWERREEERRRRREGERGGREERGLRRGREGGWWDWKTSNVKCGRKEGECQTIAGG